VSGQATSPRGLLNALDAANLQFLPGPEKPAAPVLQRLGSGRRDNAVKANNEEGAPCM
jgi:hypothetical protein